MLNGKRRARRISVKMHTLSIKKHKEREDGIAYLCDAGKRIP
jgi:hypothetical protein